MNVKKFLFALMLSIVQLTTFASTWPTKPVTLVIPFSSGSYSTLVANAVQMEIETKLKTQVNIKYMPGAGSIVAVNHVLNNDNDNHTLILFNDDFIVAQLTQGSSLHEQFVPVNIFSKFGVYVYGNSTASFDKFKETVRNRGAINLGNMGSGGGYDIWSRQLKYPGMTVNPVPYKGGAPMQNDVLGGHLDYGIGLLTTSKPLIDEGRIKLVMISSLERNHVNKDVPTFRELGIQGEPYYGFFGFFVRKDTPKETVESMSRVFREIVRTNPSFVGQMQQGINIVNFDTAKSQELVLDSVKRLEKMIKK